jgi:transposase-like protein
VLVVGAVEIRGEGSGRLRLGIVPAATQTALTTFVRGNVADGAQVFTDGLPSYTPLSSLGYDHRPEVEEGKRNLRNILPRIHRVFSNLKTWLKGTHHGVGAKNLDVYLREYEFRFNRRRTPMAAFQSLLGLTSQHEPQPVRRRGAQTVRS